MIIAPRIAATSWFASTPPLLDAVRGLGRHFPSCEAPPRSSADGNDNGYGDAGGTKVCIMILRMSECHQWPGKRDQRPTRCHCVLPVPTR